jgi:hypothetical protein
VITNVRVLYPHPRTRANLHDPPVLPWQEATQLAWHPAVREVEAVAVRATHGEDVPTRNLPRSTHSVPVLECHAALKVVHRCRLRQGQPTDPRFEGTQSMLVLIERA